MDEDEDEEGESAGMDVLLMSETRKQMGTGRGELVRAARVTQGATG